MVLNFFESVSSNFNGFVLLAICSTEITTNSKKFKKNMTKNQPTRSWTVGVFRASFSFKTLQQAAP